jgi:hypothetical protein
VLRGGSLGQSDPVLPGAAMLCSLPVTGDCLCMKKESSGSVSPSSIRHPDITVKH